MSRQALELVIVGNGAAAAEAARALRAAGYGGAVDLFAANAEPPYSPMLGVSYAAGDVPAARCFPFGGLDFYERQGVTAHLGAPVVALEPHERRLRTARGDEHVYRACLVASGAATAFPPLPGIDAPGVFGLRSFDDAVRFKAALGAAAARAAAERRPARALVLGASFAGIDVATMLGNAGLEVCLVEREASVLPRVVEAACAAAIAAHLRGRGLDVRLATALERLEASGAGLRARLRSALERGAPAGDLDIDLAVVCTGSRPNLSFLDEGAVAGGDGLLVDEHLRTGVPGLFAAGDVAQALDPASGAHVLTPLWASARRQGRVAGLTMAGVHAEFRGGVACNIQHVGDLLFACGGSLQGCDDVDVSDDDGCLTTLAYRDGRLAGFNLLGDVRRAGPLTQALAREARGARRGPHGAHDWTRGCAWTRLNAG
jgi:nitrite reductase (NADH) large subunit